MSLIKSKRYGFCSFFGFPNWLRLFGKNSSEFIETFSVFSQKMASEIFEIKRFHGTFPMSHKLKNVGQSVFK